MVPLGNDSDGVLINDGAQYNTVGPGHVSAYNGSDGVAVDRGSTTGNTITQNSIFSNDVGIDVTGGANEGIAAPVIVTTKLGSVNVIGTACAGCTVEVFGNEDSAGEGQTYLGETIADASGDLPDPDVLALEIVEDLQAALEQFSEIAEDLEAADG
jgi:hypothetical protein